MTVCALEPNSVSMPPINCSVLAYSLTIALPKLYDTLTMVLPTSYRRWPIVIVVAETFWKPPVSVFANPLPDLLAESMPLLNFLASNPSSA